MDTRTMDIYERDEAHEKWLVDQMTKARNHPDSLPEEMTDEEMQKHIDSGRMVTGTKEELLERRRKIARNRRKKQKQMQKQSRKKNRKK